MMKKFISSIKSRAIRKYHHLIDKRVLHDNRACKNIHAGKRCFVLGNGPSVKEQDITKLKNEWTIVMNNFYLHPQYRELHPKFYVVFDRRYFDDSGEGLAFFKNLEKVLHEDTIIILPLKAKRFMEKHNLLPDNKKIYIYVSGYAKNEKGWVVDISKTIPTPMSASTVGILMAIYMGFGPIYLLGMEHDWLKRKPGDTLEAFHFYDQKKQDIKDDLTVTYEYNCWCTYQLFRNYRLLQKGTAAKIINLTPNSYLDTFPFAIYEDIINSK